MAEKLEYKEHACSCDKCKSMCKKQACVGTPEEMIRISKAGFSDKLLRSYWVVGLLNKTHDHLVTIIAPKMTSSGCSFQDNNGLCILHDLGLKPSEGKLTNNHKSEYVNNYEDLINYQIIKTWENKDFNNIDRRVFRYE